MMTSRNVRAFIYIFAQDGSIYSLDYWKDIILLPKGF